MATAEGDGIGSNKGKMYETPQPPSLCLIRFAADSASGAFMGSLFGYGTYIHK